VTDSDLKCSLIITREINFFGSIDNCFGKYKRNSKKINFRKPESKPKFQICQHILLMSVKYKRGTLLSPHP